MNANKLSIFPRRSPRVYNLILVFTLLSILGAPALFAQASPWENAITLLQTSFTGPLARGLSLIAIVIGGIMFAYSEGGSKKVFAGIIFGLGMALGAVNFMTWLFGVA